VTLILAACGASGSSEDSQQLQGTGFTAQAPAAWNLERPPRTVLARSPDGPESVAVAVFRLAKPFQPELWAEAVGELNDVAARLAERLGSTALVVRSGSTTLAGRRARRYFIDYRRDGVAMQDRVVFLLSGRREYQLTCRIVVDEDDADVEACDELTRSFRLVSD
jgi:hypothetical protein